jgi:hypothetical protein
MSSNVCHQIIYLAIELSSSSWVIAYRLPANDKAKVHCLEAGDGAGLLAFIASLRHRLDPSDDASTLVVSCFEAGRDGFWLHRLLSAHGVINHVVEPTSILVTRGARRAKTDRLDAFAELWHGRDQPAGQQGDDEQDNKDERHTLPRMWRYGRRNLLCQKRPVSGRPRVAR